MTHKCLMAAGSFLIIMIYPWRMHYSAQRLYFFYYFCGRLVAMKKILWLLLALSLLCTSCAPKIYGVHKHRRDRHCGCEYVSPSAQSDDCLANNEAK